MTIHLTPEIESALADAARRQGTTPELLALDCLRQQYVPAMPEPNSATGSLADLLADHIGKLSSSEFVPGGAQMSQHSAS